jgi:hypothetical protein
MFDLYITKTVYNLYVMHTMSSLLCCFWTHYQRAQWGMVHCCVGKQEPSHGLSDDLKEVQFGSIYGI